VRRRRAGLDEVASRILLDLAPLEFDPAYPAHIRAAHLIDYHRHGRRPLVDADLALQRGMRAVAQALVAHEHDQLRDQTLRQWRRLQRFISSFEAVLPKYREALGPLLERYSEPEQTSVASFNAVSRLFIGRGLIEFATTLPPAHNDAWGDLREGMARMMEEWSAIREDDFTRHLWLWGVGKREFPFEHWAKDSDSPLGEWRLATATLHDGSHHNVILPDEPVIASGLRLHEPPRRYLESWHWIHFLLPQLVDAGVELRPDLGTAMLLKLAPA
jgi:hypothetical protein